MAFNFNWSPLTADASFYRRARDLLTAALNKSPKPPIIVDDIFVTEFNLGSVPPELEILEIGDLAEDRFRGIFKMCYGGDAFLTLKTRVQANPLSTYIDSTPSFISPQPLAAASGLTIPLSITLSEIRLSAFIILVFSKQKGLTIVFRNDPLESLKVSSTFDSIQFVRDYLQRTIEGQLRSLIMDQLPAIIHRLSLQLWCPEQVPKADDAAAVAAQEHSGTGAGATADEPADPLASPPIAPVDANGNLLDDADVSKLELDGGPEVQSMFAKLSLGSSFGLGSFNQTLMALSPSFREVVFRGWSEAAARAGVDPWSGPPTPLPTPLPTPAHSKTPSINLASLPSSPTTATTTTTTYSFSESGSVSQGALSSRPSLVSIPSSSSTPSLSLGGAVTRTRGKKKKTRVVNLRRRTDLAEDAIPETQSEAPATPTPSGTDAASIRAPMSEPLLVPAVLEDSSPTSSASTSSSFPTDRHRRSSPTPLRLSNRPSLDDIDTTPTSSPQASSPPKPTTVPLFSSSPSPSSEKQHRPVSTPLLSAGMPGFRHRAAPSSDVALDQQWIMKMASEIARRVYDESEKRRRVGAWDDAPPAYEAAR